MERTQTVLTKWNGFLAPKDSYEKTRLINARSACATLSKIARLGKPTQTNLATVIARLSRAALLTLKERQAVFGEGVIEAGLFQNILDENTEAIVLAMLDRIDEGNFAAAAKLAGDLSMDDWQDLADQWFCQWEMTHSVDAAIICLLSCHRLNVDFSNEFQKMQSVVSEKHPSFARLIESIQPIPTVIASSLVI